jgi:Nucleotidyltransferase domain.
MQHTEIIRILRDTIRRSDPRTKVILYGSQARSDALPGSDIDLLIIVDDEKFLLRQLSN